MFEELVADFEEIWEISQASLTFSTGNLLRMIAQKLSADDAMRVGGVIGKQNWSAVVLKRELEKLGEVVKPGKFATWEEQKFKVSSTEHTPVSPLFHITLTEV